MLTIKTPPGTNVPLKASPPASSKPYAAVSVQECIIESSPTCDISETPQSDRKWEQSSCLLGKEKMPRSKSSLHVCWPQRDSTLEVLPYFFPIVSECKMWHSVQQVDGRSIKAVKPIAYLCILFYKFVRVCYWKIGISRIAFRFTSLYAHDVILY